MVLMRALFLLLWAAALAVQTPSGAAKKSASVAGEQVAGEAFRAVRSGAESI
jgi:hypothetical protein